MKQVNLNTAGGQMGTKEIILILIAVITVANTVILALLKMGFTKFLKEMSDIWDAIGVIRDKQLDLREKLPEQYLRIQGPGYTSIMNSLSRIENHVGEMFRDCKDWREKYCPIAGKNHSSRE